MGRVTGLHRTPFRRAPAERLAQAELRADWGVVGDRHARPGSSRQVVLTQSEVLDDLRLSPGMTREQLTVSGAGALAAGDVVVLAGQARLELVRPRVPCRVMDGVRPGLCDELRGRGGWCARVLTGGAVRPGDEVTVERPAAEAADPPWLAAYLRALAEWEAGCTQPPADGWATFDARLSHLIAWDERAVQQIALGGRTAVGVDIDGFNAAAAERFRGNDLWVLHDEWSTAVVDAARRRPDAAEPWVRTLTAHYREHT